MNWTLKHFNDLTSNELYAVLQLRNEVFVVEQNCVFQDADDNDQSCYHLMGWEYNKLLAYSRIVPPGISYKEPSIGRVVTSPSSRRKGLGKELMKESINAVEQLYRKIPIRIGAQQYLIPFYESFGFFIDGEIYLEDGIPHVIMLKS
jgi:ElaA protein